MKSTEFITEGLIDFIKRVVGFAWGKPGDIVRGSVVADYLDEHMYLGAGDRTYISKHKYKLTNISSDEASRYRTFSDQEAGTDIINSDPFKMDQARARNVTYQSLTQTPPVLAKDGFIIDGNHRVQRAIELGLTSIPVLQQI